MKTLTVGDIVKEGVAIGLKNAGAVIVNGLLWLLTIWIPYLNVGTTIALTNLAAKMGKDEGLEMTEIFKPHYRKFMGEYFLVLMFTFFGSYIGFFFLIVPGMVMQIAWGLAPLLVLDKGMEPIAAIKKSNELTYGHKWTIFGGNVVLFLLLGVAITILSTIGNFIHMYVGLAFTLIGMLLFFPIMTGATAYIYKTLTSN
ncbi:MAG: YciC family protein [Leptospiraceae bacterium]|nr:YciC family protein [Leptospiraceae bacterium]